jgi:addiction module RelE/StbE family toxin
VSVLYSPEARADLLHALAYLLQRNPAAARKLQQAVERLVEQLEAHQFDGHADRLNSGQTVRSWPLPPWRLYYQRRPNDVLWIVRFYHQRRQPIAPSSRRRPKQTKR